LRGKPKQEQQRQEENPMVAFMYGIKSPETKRQYPRRLKMFFNFLDFSDGDIDSTSITKTIEEQAKIFLSMARSNKQWTEESFMRFVGFST
jgi:hypothetical protein